MKLNLNKRIIINICILVLLNLLANQYYFRLDLTEEKRHSIHNTSQEILSSINDIMYVKVYLSGDLPAGFVRLKSSTKDMLDEFRNFTSYIEYDFIDPNNVKNDQERQKIYNELSENGLEPTNLQIQDNNSNSQQIIFPGAIIYYKGRSLSLNLLQNQIGTNPQNVLNNSVENIEFELINTIHKLVKNNKPTIAFLDGHNELNELQTADITHSLGLIKGSLSEYFNVERINIKEFELDQNQNASLSKQLQRLNQYQAIIIAKPTIKFSKVDKFLIDQYIMNGGKTLWFVDGVKMDMDSLKGSAPFSMALPNDLNLSDMFFKYGVRVNYDLVMDFQADKIPIIVGYKGDVPQQQLLPWFYNPIIIPKNKQAIVKNIDGIKSSFVSSIDTVLSQNVKKTPILFSSPYSKLPKAPHRVSLNILEQTPSLEQFNDKEIPIAYLLEGQFESVFNNRLSPTNDFKPLYQSKENAMIIVADGDIIKNHVSSTEMAYPLGYNHYSKTQYNGNKSLIVNSLNYLLGNADIINIRTKELRLRLLNKKIISSQRLKWQLINTLLPIVFVLSFIFCFNYVRKRRYQ